MRSSISILLAISAILLLLPATSFATITKNGSPDNPAPAAVVPYIIEGVVSTIDYDKGFVTLVQPGSGNQIRAYVLPMGFFVTPTTKILKNEQIAVLKEVLVGDQCRAEVKQEVNGVPFALNMRLRTPGLKWQPGVVNSVDTTGGIIELKIPTSDNTTPVTVKFSLDASTMIRKNGKPVGLGDILPGDVGRIGFIPVPAADPSAAIPSIVVEVYTPKTPNVILEGVISVIDTTTGAVTLVAPSSAPAKPPVTFYVVDSTKIMKNGAAAAFSALAVNDICRAEAQVASNGSLIALNVQAKTPVIPLKTAKGTISAVDVTGSTFDLKSDGTGIIIHFTVNANTKIGKNGVKAGLGDLAVGDLAAVAYSQPSATENVAAGVEAKTPVVPGIIIEGIISVLDPGKGTVTVVPPPGAPAKPPVTFLVVSTTKITKDGVIADFSKLVVGDGCRAEVKPASDSSLVALNIQAKTPPTKPQTITVRGTITYIDLTGSTFELKIADSGTTVKLSVNSATIIRKNGVLAGLSDLAINDAGGVTYMPAMEVGGVNIAMEVSVGVPPVIIQMLGVITKIDINASTVFVLPLNATPGTIPVPFLVDSATAIQKMGAVTIAALCEKDQVGVGYIKPASGAAVAKGILVQPSSFTGKVTKIDVATRVLSVQSNLTTMEFKAAPDAKIMKDGRPAGFDSIKLGNAAEVKFFHFKDGNVAVGIGARTL